MVRSQISLEFITGVTVMLVIYVVVLSGYKYYTENNIIEDAIAENICYNVASAIDATVIGREEYYLNISVPYTVYTKELSKIKVSNNFTLTVYWKDKITACSIITNNITAISIYPGKTSSGHIGEKIYLTSIYTNKSTYSQTDLPVQINVSYIDGADGSIIIKDSNGATVYTNSTITQQNNIISDIWVPGSETGTFTIYAKDNSNQFLSSERIITIL